MLDTSQSTDEIQSLLPITFTVERVPWRAFRDGQIASWKAFRPRWIYGLFGLVFGMTSTLITNVPDARLWHGYWIGIAVLCVLSILQGIVTNRALYRRSQVYYPAKFSIDESGISAHNRSSSTTLTWSAFRSAVSTRDALIVLFKTGDVYVFPVDALPVQPSYYAAAIKKRIADAA